MAKRTTSQTTITLVLTKVTTGATSSGAPYLYTAVLPDGVVGCCRQSGTEDATQVAFFGKKPKMVAIDSEIYKRLLAEQARNGR